MPASAQYPSSNAALNMLTAMYAKELRGTPVKVNAANPGYTATDFNDHRGLRLVAQGAEPACISPRCWTKAPAEFCGATYGPPMVTAGTAGWPGRRPGPVVS
jgi:NAD(P)-dependent dehydrogenase (short-subunit alcohol dehydrogenase family)